MTFCSLFNAFFICGLNCTSFTNYSKQANCGHTTALKRTLEYQVEHFKELFFMSLQIDNSGRMFFFFFEGKLFLFATQTLLKRLQIFLQNLFSWKC